MDDDAGSLARQFEIEWRLAAAACMELPTPYRPWAWIPLSEELGAVGAARLLVLDPGPASGLRSLVMRGRIDLTVERAVIVPRWRRLFDGATSKRPHAP